MRNIADRHTSESKSNPVPIVVGIEIKEMFCSLKYFAEESFHIVP
jgi:hypothetical protein